MTTPVARLVSTRMREAPLPLRLSYVVPASRYEEPQEGRMREFTTAGLELIGPESLDADAESLFTAIEALDALGLGDAHFDINHVAIVDGVLAGLELDAWQLAESKILISGRNIVALRSCLAGSGPPEAVDAIVRLALTRGREDVLESARSLCRTDAGLLGIERLRALLERAATLGYGERLNVDCSLLRDIEYYTGFIFEGFADEVGFGLCGGGRYDTLLPRFGFESGAVGWSLSVERMLIALERRHSTHVGAAPAIDVLVSGSDVIAARERAAGKIVRIDFDRRGEAELIEEARRQRIPRLVIATSGNVREVEVTW
jgi:ATP phosphoribosyltransferase regulatory subunit